MLLDTALDQYLLEIEQMLRTLDDSYVERYEEEVLAHDRINLRLRIRMGDNFLLELNEAVVAHKDKVRHLNYRYHFQDGRNNLIFRYDNTPHFPDLNSFPNHKHLPNGVAESEKPTILSVFKEAMATQKEPS